MPRNPRTRLRQLQLRVLGDHLLESVGHEADRQLHVVAIAFGAENGSVSDTWDA